MTNIITNPKVIKLLEEKKLIKNEIVLKLTKIPLREDGESHLTEVTKVKETTLILGLK